MTRSFPLCAADALRSVALVPFPTRARHPSGRTARNPACSLSANRLAVEGIAHGARVLARPARATSTGACRQLPHQLPGVLNRVPVTVVVEVCPHALRPARADPL